MERTTWQFRGVGTDIEAFVLAADYEVARELFQGHLRVHGGDPDTLLYRELSLEHLEQPERSSVERALGLKRDGVVTQDSIRGWVFITPVGSDEPERLPK